MGKLTPQRLRDPVGLAPVVGASLGNHDRAPAEPRQLMVRAAEELLERIRLTAISPVEAVEADPIDPLVPWEEALEGHAAELVGEGRPHPLDVGRTATAEDAHDPP